LNDLPPDVARAEKSSDVSQSEPTPTDPGQHNVAHKARAIRRAKASDRTSRDDREPSTIGDEDVTIPFIPPGEAGGRLPNDFRNCEEPPLIDINRLSDAGFDVGLLIGWRTPSALPARGPGADGKALPDTPPRPTGTKSGLMAGVSQAPGLILATKSAAAPKTAMFVRTATA
jgi:hypothetical protein